MRSRKFNDIEYDWAESAECEIQYTGKNSFDLRYQGWEKQEYRRTASMGDFVAVSKWMTDKGYENVILSDEPQEYDYKIKIVDEKMLFLFLLTHGDKIFPKRRMEYYE